MTDSDKLLSTLQSAREETAKVIIGHRDAIDLALIAIFTRGHALVEGVPGVAKTLLVKTLAHVLGGSFARIQFTPDMMPSDITGVNVYDAKRGEFTLVHGPVFSDFLLADEINRAPARTQAGLLEAMQERAVTIDRKTYPLPAGFSVFATQNPIEFEGTYPLPEAQKDTYPLPEAQKDRFMLKLDIHVPGRDDELTLARRSLGDSSPEDVLQSGAVRQVLTPGALASVRHALSSIVMREELVSYAVDLVRRTREHEAVLLGPGPRATQALCITSRAHAAVRGRDFVSPDDVKLMARAALSHRIALRPEFDLEGLSAKEVVSRVLEEVAVPK
jgi:MoxR-like ATPase